MDQLGQGPNRWAGFEAQALPLGPALGDRAVSMKRAARFPGKPVPKRGIRHFGRTGLSTLGFSDIAGCLHPAARVAYTINLD